MNSRFFLLFIVIFMVIILLSGCWSYREIDRLAIVSGLAIDKNHQSNKLRLTAEVIDMQGSLTEGKVKSRRVESEGDTIFDAVRNMISISAKRLYWSHTKAIIVSQDVAKEGITPIIDFISRNNEPRLTMTIFVSKEKTAKELLEQQSVSTDIRAFEMEYMLMGNKNLSKSVNVEVSELIDILSGKGVSSYLPAIGVTLNDGKKTANLSGTAVFKRDKLVGFLNKEDTKFFLFIKNKIKGGLLTIAPDKENVNNKVTLNIFKNKTNIKPIYLGEKLLLKIDVNTEVSIGEIDSNINYMTEKNRDILKKETERYLKKNIENVVKKVQKDFDSDIFGFGRTIMEDMPSLWKDIENEWDEVFKTLETEANVRVNIKDSGLISKPIQVGD